MNRYKAKFEKLTSETLLRSRALGDELADEAHSAIEEIFVERGEILPLRPSTPVLIGMPKKGDATLKFIGVLLFFIAAGFVARVVNHSWLLLPVVFIYAAYYAFKWVRKSSMSPEKREAEDVEQKAKDEALTELMVSAASGDLGRVKELVAFGADVNARSLSDTTALMYAARNNHSEVVDCLLAVGANLRAVSKKGSSAIALAERFGHHDLAEKLKQYG